MSASGDKRISRSLSLTVRMVLVTVLTPLTALLLLAAVVIFLPNRFLFGLAFALPLGALARFSAYKKRKQPPGRTLTEREDPELFAVVDRLCALADIPRPVLVLSERREPNSWVVHFPGQTPRLYVTTGLLELLTPNELQAVLGHELAHIANRDALVMSVVGLPGSVMMRASAGGGIDALLVVAIGVFSQLGTVILSRYRELAADAGSAAITGRPSALASALLKVSDSLAQVPSKDLRAVAALNAFNLVPVPPRHRWCGPLRPLQRVGATHPPLQARLDALSALERRQHSPYR